MRKKLLLTLAVLGIAAVVAQAQGNVETVKPVAVSKPAPAVAEPAVDKPVQNEPAEQGGDSLGEDILMATLLYIPNRLLDLSDCVSLETGVGAQVACDIYVTRWVGLGGFYGEKYFLEKGYERQCGGGYQSGWNYHDTLTREYWFVDNTFGSVIGDYVFDHTQIRLPQPSDYIYEQHIRDFWAIGAQAGWVFNVRAEVHPIEIADFITGIFLIDLGDDDFEKTAAIRLQD